MNDAKVEQSRDSSLTNKLMTYVEVAHYCGVHERTIARWVEKHGMPAIKPGGVVRFNLDAVDKWLLKKPRSLRNVSRQG